MKVKDVFELIPGNSFELIDMEKSENANVNFVSRASTHNGVTGVVDERPDCTPFAAGLLTVALSGNGVCSSFVQTRPFYTAYHVMILSPKIPMTFNQKMYYALCIKKNAYRYAWGRQANKTLKDIELPDTIPAWVDKTPVLPVSTAIEKASHPPEHGRFQEFLLGDIFEVKYGINLELLNCSITDTSDANAVNFVARTSQNNGVVAKVKLLEGIPPQPAGVLTCAGGGSVLSTFVQNAPFYSGRDLYLLIPKSPMSLLAKLFCCTIIEANKYRFSYGRQANKTLRSLRIKLPANADGTPDFEYMDSYMKLLPYSDRL